VVITGGEPMVNTDLPELVQNLKTSAKHITIETAGIAFIPDIPCDLMSISPKLSNSTPADPLGELIDNYDYQLKFIVDSQGDLQEIQQTIEEIGNVDPGKVMLMPQAETREELLAKAQMVVDLCKHTGFAFCQRLQTMLWNGRRDT
jgi:7-carboxy-7-deazaguanine synthase